jgi:hypothetical protein
MNCFRGVDGHHGMKILDCFKVAGFILEYVHDKIVRQKKQDQAERNIKKLLYNGGALFYKDTIALRKFIGTSGSVPRLFSRYYIYYVVMIAPYVLIFVLKRAVIYAYEGVSATELPVNA